MEALLRDGPAEELCDHPDCFAYRPRMYSTQRAHSFVQLCAWRSPDAALHLTADRALALADRRSGLVTFAHPLAWSRSIQLVRLAGGQGIVRIVFGPWIRGSAGPYPIEDAEALEDALDRLTTPRRAVRATAAQLAADPAAFDGELVMTEGTWRHAFEACTFAGMWSTLPSGRDGHATAIGLVLANPARRYGHMGGYRAELIVIEER